jgi:hypothetical protein
MEMASKKNTKVIVSNFARALGLVESTTKQQEINGTVALMDPKVSGGGAEVVYVFNSETGKFYRRVNTGYSKYSSQLNRECEHSREKKNVRSIAEQLLMAARPIMLYREHA